MIAAMTTAANLGARATGWGFVVFAIGAVTWSLVGMASGQTNLLATNIFPTLVNVVGISLWLGRQRAYEDSGKAARPAPLRKRFPASSSTDWVWGKRRRRFRGVFPDIAGQWRGAERRHSACDSRLNARMRICSGRSTD